MCFQMHAAYRKVLTFLFQTVLCLLIPKAQKQTLYRPLVERSGYQKKKKLALLSFQFLSKTIKIRRMCSPHLPLKKYGMSSMHYVLMMTIYLRSQMSFVLRKVNVVKEANQIKLFLTYPLLLPLNLRRPLRQSFLKKLQHLGNFGLVYQQPTSRNMVIVQFH